MWRSLARFDHRCSMRTWVYRVAHNVATSHVLRPRANAPTFVEPVALDSLPDSVDQADRYDRQRTLERVYALIRELEPVDRQVMLLYLEEVDAATTSDITGLSARNVATKIHRIKQMLAQRFREKGRVMDESPRDVHRIWQQQPREESGVSENEVRVKAERLERRVRGWKTIGGPCCSP